MIKGIFSRFASEIKNDRMDSSVGLVCIVCGKTFSYQKNGAKGRLPLCCSEQCRRKRRSKIQGDWIKKRYASDEEFRTDLKKKSLEAYYEKQARKKGYEVQVREPENIRTRCEGCGREFEYEHNGGRLRKYCSEKCSQRVKNRNFYEKAKEWRRERYRTDENYRARMLEINNRSSRKRRENANELGIDELVTSIASAKSTDEIRQILEERTRLKSEVRNKYIRANKEEYGE